MIFSEKLLYLHVPKTGGMSFTDVLLTACPPPVYYTHPDVEPRWAQPGVYEIDGIRHETLEEAAIIVHSFGFSLDAFPLILATVRNPYEIEVSRFAYYRNGYAWDAHHKGRDHAMAGDFRSFALTAEPHGGPDRSIERYFLLGDAQPANLRIARYEHLAPDIQQLLAQVGISVEGLEIPHHNVSLHGPWPTYYDAESEAAVYERYRWLFESGYYERLEVPE